MGLKIKTFSLMLLLSLITNCKAQEVTSGNESKSTIEVRAELYKKLGESRINLENKFNEIISFLDSIGTKEALTYKKLISESQSYWKKYSKLDCEIDEYESRDGAQGGSPFYNICKTDMNNQRLKRLSRLFAQLKREFRY